MNFVAKVFAHGPGAIAHGADTFNFHITGGIDGAGEGHGDPRLKTGHHVGLGLTQVGSQLFGKVEEKRFHFSLGNGREV